MKIDIDPSWKSNEVSNEKTYLRNFNVWWDTNDFSICRTTQDSFWSVGLVETLRTFFCPWSSYSYFVYTLLGAYLHLIIDWCASGKERFLSSSLFATKTEAYQSHVRLQYQQRNQRSLAIPVDPQPRERDALLNI